jgi:hypothetical protein
VSTGVHAFGEPFISRARRNLQVKETAALRELRLRSRGTTELVQFNAR